MLASAMRGRENHFDFWRLLAAIAVIFSHSFDLTGIRSREPLIRYTHGEMSIGEFSVVVFFVISGFLITQSFERTPDLKRFLKARFLRIYPAAIAMVLVTVFLLGPLVTSLPLAKYFSDSLTWRYLTTVILAPIWTPGWLPGVFEHNPMALVVNGSLWTLEFELICYVIVAALGVLKLLRKDVTLVLLAIGFLGFRLTVHSVFLQGFFYLFPYFGAGMVLYLFREKIRLSLPLATICIVLVLILGRIGFMHEAMLIAGSYAIIVLCLTPRLKLPRGSIYGDFSYGAYIFAFPIQQTVVQLLFPSLTPVTLFLIATPFTLLVAFASWHLIEKRALHYRLAQRNTANEVVKRAW